MSEELRSLKVLVHRWCGARDYATSTQSPTPGANHHNVSLPGHRASPAAAAPLLPSLAATSALPAQSGARAKRLVRCRSCHRVPVQFVMKAQPWRGRAGASSHIFQRSTFKRDGRGKLSFAVLVAGFRVGQRQFHRAGLPLVKRWRGGLLPGAHYPAYIGAETAPVFPSSVAAGTGALLVASSAAPRSCRSLMPLAASGCMEECPAAASSSSSVNSSTGARPRLVHRGSMRVDTASPCKCLVAPWSL